MNGAQLHLAFNHIALIGVGFGLAVYIYGLIRKSNDVLRAALLIFIGCAVGAGMAYLTGDPAEHVVEEFPHVARGMIEQHEDMATTALILFILTGLASLGALWILHVQKKLTRLVNYSMLILVVLSLVIVGITAKFGGQIAHPETRAGFVTPPDHGEEEED